MLKTSLATLFLLICLAPAGRAAQSTYGAVVGVVTDSSDAVLPGVAVTLTEVQTNVVRTAVTKDTGAYEFLNLTQGLYRVDFVLDGFRKFESEPFRVEARESKRIGATMAVGALAEEVQVRSVAPLINTETPTVSSATSNRELQELPFTFRTQNTSPILAIQIIPEVQRANQQFSLSGSLPYQNEVSVDGILTTSVRRNGIGAEGFNIFPSIESIEQIKVSSVSNTAEYAQLGDITTISRPGTNTYRGTGFWNYNSAELNANPNYFNPSLEPSSSHNHDFGVSLGGPLVRNKTFFFATFERLDISLAQTATATVPSANYRGGDFSALATPILDPTTGQPFAGNVIPAARLNPVALKLLQSYIPAPNDGTAINRYSIDATQESNQFDIRVDQNFKAGHTLFGRWSQKKEQRLSPTRYASLGPKAFENPVSTFVVSDNYAISSRLLNEARVGYTKADQNAVTGKVGKDLDSELGLRLLQQNLPGGTGTTYVSIAGYTQFGESQEEPLTQDTFQIADSLTWLRARHTMKAGFDIQRFNWTSPVNFTGADDFGVFRFDNNLVGGGTGNPMANFLLGLPTDVDQTASGPNIDGIATHYSMFVQDEWRASSNLTVSAGLRYDLRPGFVDREGNISNFLRDTPNGDVVVPDDTSLKLTAPGFAGSIGNSSILTAEQAGLPLSLRNTDTNNVAPRFGIAWRPGGDTRSVIRAGYGIYYTRILGAVFNSLTGIHTSDNVTFPNTFDPVTRVYGIVWPNTFVGDPSRGVSRVGTQNFSTANDPDFKDPSTQQWSLTYERELNRRNAVRITYSGFKSTDLTLAPDLNQIAPNTVGYSNLPASVRPYPNWARVNTRDNGGYHLYNDVLAQLRGSLDRVGLSHTTSYKWAHSIDNIEDRGAGQGDFQSEINGRTDDRFDPDYMRGPTTNIPTHRVVSSLIWQVPVGRDRALLSGMGTAMNAVLGGWQVSSVFQVQSGSHLTAYYTSHCGSGTNCYGSEKADDVSGQDPNDGPRTLARWFNTGAYSVAAFQGANGRSIFAGRFGDAQKGAILGPGVWNLDFAAMKDFRLSSSTRFAINIFVTNLFDHANWGRPDTNVTSQTYGRITTLNSDFPLRRVVLGGRFSF
ncbi:MAG: carboxypeptidase-like regulatory domain-containing protein [Acidobacteriota bacterium]